LLSKAVSGSTGSLGEFGWAGAAGAAVFIDTDKNLAMVYAHHMLNPQEEYYLPRVRNTLYQAIG
jgi:CubicO group peptidase (beta-lactamase class C family)